MPVERIRDSFSASSPEEFGNLVRFASRTDEDESPQKTAGERKELNKAGDKTGWHVLTLPASGEDDGNGYQKFDPRSVPEINAEMKAEGYTLLHVQGNTATWQKNASTQKASWVQDLHSRSFVTTSLNAPACPRCKVGKASIGQFTCEGCGDDWQIFSIRERGTAGGTKFVARPVDNDRTRILASRED